MSRKISKGLKYSSIALILIISLLLNTVMLFADDPSGDSNGSGDGNGSVTEENNQAPGAKPDSDSDHQPLDDTDLDSDSPNTVGSDESTDGGDADRDTAVEESPNVDSTPLSDPGTPVPLQDTTAIYLNGENGDNNNNGLSPDNAVKTFARAKQLAEENQNIDTIYVCGTVEIADEISLAGTKAILKRYKSPEGNLFQDDLLRLNGGEASLKDITVDGNCQTDGKYPSTYTKGSLVDLNAGTLTIEDGTVLQNNAKWSSTNDFKGGAIYSLRGKIIMSGGEIKNNISTFGGGIYLNKSVMEMSGGRVSANKALNSNTEPDGNQGDYRASGGGITIMGGSKLTLTAFAEISDNFSDEIGGGISVGSRVWSEGIDELYMEGGEILRNTARGTGGGIFISTKFCFYEDNKKTCVGLPAKAYINAGLILNNQVTRNSETGHAFGGGGIYVNGSSNVEDNDLGTLYLKNALIIDNESEWEGGGYAACPVTKTEIHLTDGAAIYNNKSANASKTWGADPIQQTHQDAHDIYILSSYLFGLHSGNPNYEISEYMLGGQAYNWTFSQPSVKDLKGELQYGEFLALKAGLSGNNLTQQLAKVIISGNKSASRGGGIGSNGRVIIGTPEGGLISIPVEKAWLDKNDEQKLRPDSVTIKLFAKVANQAEPFDTGLELILSAVNDWKGEFKNLAEKSNGEAIIYTIVEQKVAGYDSVIKGNPSDGFTVENSLTPPPTVPSEPSQPTQPTTPTPSYPVETPSVPIQTTVPRGEVVQRVPQVPATGEADTQPIIAFSFTLAVLLLAVQLFARKSQ
ncbi:MAG: Cna B-type domain-containing protein [Eubacteriales bacterium]|nr:Cna B-type domain-containing protein [Eubacteriales bacterium]